MLNDCIFVLLYSTAIDLSLGTSLAKCIYIIASALLLGTYPETIDKFMEYC